MEFLKSQKVIKTDFKVLQRKNVYLLNTVIEVTWNKSYLQVIVFYKSTSIKIKILFIFLDGHIVQNQTTF